MVKLKAWFLFIVLFFWVISLIVVRKSPNNESMLDRLKEIDETDSVFVQLEIEIYSSFNNSNEIITTLNDKESATFVEILKRIEFDEIDRHNYMWDRRVAVSVGQDNINLKFVLNYSTKDSLTIWLPEGKNSPFKHAPGLVSFCEEIILSRDSL